MSIIKRNPFGHILFLKKWLIRILGALTHRRFRGFNELKIEGSEIIKNLPDKNVLFVNQSGYSPFSNEREAILSVKTIIQD